MQLRLEDNALMPTFGGNKRKSKHSSPPYAAQRLIEQAINRVSTAQGANEFDMDGHAIKAKQLLDQADAKIKMAAQAANHNKR